MRSDVRRALWIAFWLCLAPVPSGSAQPIGPGDFDADMVVLSFDGFAHGATISNDLECAKRVLLRSTAPIGQEFSADPADWLHPGEAVAPFVAAITAVPSSSTSSPPNKVIATKYDAGGGLVLCERCGIALEFLDPLPTKVGFYVTDVDAGQSAIFSGPSGLLGVVVTAGATGGPEFVGWADPGGISVVILRSRQTAGIGFDDLMFSGAGPAMCAVPSADTDGDGEPDTTDLCPSTPHGASLALVGCTEEQFCSGIGANLCALPAADADADGEPDASDACAGTPAGHLVDASGCSLEQFCATFEITKTEGRARCIHADWRNDEPIQAKDCNVRGGRQSGEPRCLAR